MPNSVSLSVVVPATDAPRSLERCLAAIGRAVDPPDEVVVVRRPASLGPAAARNDGIRRSRGRVIAFVDADVEVCPDAFTRIRSAFARDPELAAVFGSYDDAPSEPGIVSQFRNLLHHHVHHSSAGAATTFWAGLGAARRGALEQVGGFDERRFRTASVEDIDLGRRLSRRGLRLELDPAIQGAHLKRWSLVAMVSTDFARRGVPWLCLLLEARTGSTALNLGWRHRLSALASVAALGAAVGRRPHTGALAAGAMLALNLPFYRLLSRRLGARRAAVGVGLHALHHLTAVAALPVGTLVHLEGRARRRGGAVAEVASGTAPGKERELGRDQPRLQELWAAASATPELDPGEPGAAGPMPSRATAEVLA